MIIQPAKNPLQGSILVAGDKSISHRALILGAIADGTTHITGFLEGDDCLATMACLRELGVAIEQSGTDVTVHGVGLRGLRAPADMLPAGNSGTTLRLLTGLLSAQSFQSSITGDKSLRTRPMRRVIKPLELMGADIRAREDQFCPLHIRGQALRGIAYSLPVASAQLKSALLLAGLYAQGKTAVTEPTASRDHTERMLRRFGAELVREGNTVTLTPAQALAGCEIDVPGDLSSAAFLMVAAAILPSSCVTLRHVGLNPTRCGIVEALDAMGGDVTVTEQGGGDEPFGDITVRYAPLHGITIGGDLIPRMIDEIPIFCVAAAFAKGKTVVKDAAELKLKESNRIDMIVNECSKAGVEAKGTEDGLTISGGNRIAGTIYTPHGDHRIAMAMAVLALRGETPSQMIGASCADISFPHFYDILQSLQGE